MSISGISSTTSAYQADVQSALQRLKTDFMDLAESLDSGDLAAARPLLGTAGGGSYS